MDAPGEVPPLFIHREEAAGQTILRLEGRFDGNTAQLLRCTLEELPGDVVLDFSRVHDFRDVAVPALTRGLEGRRFRLVGLPHHQERMFRYFGWWDGSEESPSYYVPERSAEA